MTSFMSKIAVCYFRLTGYKKKTADPVRRSAYIEELREINRKRVEPPRGGIKSRDGAIYPLGSGQARPLREYFEMLRDAVDPALPLGLGEIPYPPNQVMHLEADISQLTRDTGFKPATPFETGIRRVVEQYRQRLVNR